MTITQTVTSTDFYQTPKREIFMPVRITKTDGKYRVSTPGGVKAKGTTKAKAHRQANLLRAVEHGFKPTGKPARDLRKKK